MTVRTATGKGLERPHKHEAAKPGIGASMKNAKTISTEKHAKTPASKSGVAHSYFGNSRDIDTSNHRGKK